MVHVGLTVQELLHLNILVTTLEFFLSVQYKNTTSAPRAELIYTFILIFINAASALCHKWTEESWSLAVEPSGQGTGSTSCIKKLRLGNRVKRFREMSGCRPNSARGRAGRPGRSPAAHLQKNWCVGRCRSRQRRRAGRRCWILQDRSPTKNEMLHSPPLGGSHTCWRRLEMSHGPRRGRHRRTWATSGTWCPSGPPSHHLWSRSCSRRCWESGNQWMTVSRGGRPGTRGCCCGWGPLH